MNLYPFQIELLKLARKHRDTYRNSMSLGKTISFLGNPCNEIALGERQLCCLVDYTIIRYMRIGGKLVAVGGWF